MACVSARAIQHPAHETFILLPHLIAVLKMSQVAVGGGAVGGEGGGKQIAGGAGGGEGGGKQIAGGAGGEEGGVTGGGGLMTPLDAPSSSSSADASTFSVLTLNVWFQNYYCELRMERVVSEVRRLQPDLLCLQEVNKKLLKLLDLPLRQLGYSTQSVLQNPYGEMLWFRLCRVTDVQLSQQPFHDSQQGRSLHLVRCVVAGRPLATATVHLESEAANSSVRFAQLGRSLQQLQDTGVPFLLAGDTNLNEKDDTILASDNSVMRGVNDGGPLMRVL